MKKDEENQQEQQLIKAIFDVTDPEAPKYIKSEPKKKQKSKNAENQARHREKQKESGNTLLRCYVKEEKKDILEDIVYKLNDGEDVLRSKEFDALNKNLTDLNQQIKGLSSQLEKSQKELEASQAKIQKVPTFVKWFCGI